jgi:hypothetical protein
MSVAYNEPMTSRSEEQAAFLLVVARQAHGALSRDVADSALFPKASEINPCVTVRALADLAAGRIRANAGGLR